MSNSVYTHAFHWPLLPSGVCPRSWAKPSSPMLPKLRWTSHGKHGVDWKIRKTTQLRRKNATFTRKWRVSRGIHWGLLLVYNGRGKLRSRSFITYASLKRDSSVTIYITRCYSRKKRKLNAPEYIMYCNNNNLRHIKKWPAQHSSRVYHCILD